MFHNWALYYLWKVSVIDYEEWLKAWQSEWDFEQEKEADLRYDKKASWDAADSDWCVIEEILIFAQKRYNDRKNFNQKY